MRWFALGLVLAVGCGWDEPRRGERAGQALGGAGGVAATFGGAGGAEAHQDAAGEAGEALEPRGGSGGLAGLGVTGRGGASATNGAAGNPQCLIGLQDGTTTTCSDFFQGSFTCSSGVCTGCPTGKLDCNGLGADGCEFQGAAGGFWFCE